VQQLVHSSLEGSSGHDEIDQTIPQVPAFYWLQTQRYMSVDCGDYCTHEKFKLRTCEKFSEYLGYKLTTSSLDISNPDENVQLTAGRRQRESVLHVGARKKLWVSPSRGPALR
jgi:hypothetical protein